MSENTLTPKLMTARECADVLRLHPRTIRRLLPGIRVGPRAVRYEAEELAALIERGRGRHDG